MHPTVNAMLCVCQCVCAYMLVCVRVAACAQKYFYEYLHIPLFLNIALTAPTIIPTTIPKFIHIIVTFGTLHSLSNPQQSQSLKHSAHIVSCGIFMSGFHCIGLSHNLHFFIYPYLLYILSMIYHI